MKKFLRPTTGHQITHPTGAVLPKEGAEVRMDSFWHRRLRDGDVEVEEAPESEGDVEVSEAPESEEASS
ncbi:MAG: DUF2635 domain-containing protein [Myxococcota bacterium]